MRGRRAPRQAHRALARGRPLPRLPPDDRRAAALEEARRRDPGEARPRRLRLRERHAARSPRRARRSARRSTWCRAPRGLAAHDPGGLEVLEADLAAFARGPRPREPHAEARAHRPALFSGIGNAYSDEILHRARLSPVKLTGAPRRRRGRRASSRRRARRSASGPSACAREAGDGFPEKVTAFREGMAVHGRYREPCPDCGAPVQRIVYAENETNYCARCQTGGRLLADRALSRLLREDWPRTLEELGGAAALREARGSLREHGEQVVHEDPRVEEAGAVDVPDRGPRRRPGRPSARGETRRGRPPRRRRRSASWPKSASTGAMAPGPAAVRKRQRPRGAARRAKRRHLRGRVARRIEAHGHERRRARRGAGSPATCRSTRWSTAVAIGHASEQER